MAIYGYCRISKATQNIERQERNILAAYPQAYIIKEAYTGTKIDRPQFERLLVKIKQGDTIVFDSVSRMSRNAEEGWLLYKKLFEQNIDLVYLKEPQVNTQTYKEAMQNGISMTGTDVDCILDGINKYLLRLAQRQIQIAFEQAQKEVDDLHRRTSEGMMTAKLAGKQVGHLKGSTYETKKSKQAKEEIKKHSKSFGGSLSDIDCIKLTGLSRNTYFKYKKEIKESMIYAEPTVN